MRRYRCTERGHVWRQDTTAAAAPLVKVSRHAMLSALKYVVSNRVSIAPVPANLGASWHTVNDAFLAAGYQLLIDDPHRVDRVEFIGVDQHALRYTRPSTKYVP